MAFRHCPFWPSSVGVGGGLLEFFALVLSGARCPLLWSTLVWAKMQLLEEVKLGELLG